MDARRVEASSARSWPPQHGSSVTTCWRCCQAARPQYSAVASAGRSLTCHSASAAGWVQMRCRECEAEVAATARMCVRCGAPIVGQPPPLVVHTVVGAVSDAAGKAVTAGVAGQAPPEPYVPGSGDKLPPKLRLVLGGYVGVACGLLAGALACALFSFPMTTPTRTIRTTGCCSSWSAWRAWGAVRGVQGARGAYPVFQAAPAAQRSTYGYGDGLEAWWAHADT